MVRLRVTDSSGTSRDTSTTVVVGSAPEATIDTPSLSTPWSVGEQVGFSAHADPTSRTAISRRSAFQWSFFLHHCYTPSDCHPHHLQDLPGPSGSFVAPDHEYPARLELRLTVTDGDGIEDTESVTIDPRTAELHVQTDPPGLELAVGNAVATAPFTQTVIAGSKTPLIASSPQTVDDTTYEFSQWSDGGPATHSVVVSGEETHVATFRARSRPPVANAGADRSVAHRARFTLDGSGSSDGDGDPWRTDGYR